MNDERPLCCGCGKPIQRGEPRWTAHEPAEHWHYACAEETRLAVKITSGAQDYRLVKKPGD